METEGTGKQLEEVEKRHQVLSGDMEDTGRESERLKAGYEELEQTLADLERRMAADRDELSQGTVLKGNLEGQINVLKEQIHTEEMNEEHLSSRRTVITGELEVKKGQLSSYEEEYSLMDAQVSDARERQNMAQGQLDRQDELIRTLDDSIEAAKAAVIQSLNEKASLTARQQRYETMLEQVNLRRSEVTQKLLKYKSDESVQDELIHKEQTALDQVRELMENKQFLAQETEDAMTEAEGEVRRLTRNQNDTQQEYHMAYTKLESLKNLAERYDGYGNSIRRVMEVRDRVHGIHGVVADIISTEQKYETAIETALGGSIQNIVTDSEATAKQLIEYLKKNKYGRATFLPLTSINGNQHFPQPAALKEKRRAGSGKHPGAGGQTVRRPGRISFGAGGGGGYH